MIQFIRNFPLISFIVIPFVILISVILGGIFTGLFIFELAFYFFASAFGVIAIMLGKELRQIVRDKHGSTSE
jgi:hypothetical protein